MCAGGVLHCNWDVTFGLSVGHCPTLNPKRNIPVAVQHTTSTHTPQDRHLAAPYAAFVKEIINSIAPEDGRVSPKHVELK